MHEERRKNKRFEIRQEVFAAFIISDGAVVVGRVLDASQCGMAVQYLAIRQLEAGPTSISIFGLDSSRMNRIESTVLYDLEVDENSWSNPQIRRCGIKFEEHRSEFKSQLKEIFRVPLRCKAATAT